MMLVLRGQPDAATCLGAKVKRPAIVIAYLDRQFEVVSLRNGQSKRILEGLVEWVV